MSQLVPFEVTRERESVTPKFADIWIFWNVSWMVASKTFNNVTQKMFKLTECKI